MQDSSEHAEFRSNGKGAEIIALLKARKLPQMVDWVDPELLAKIGVRTVISGTMGQYADQRLMQAATDRAEEKDLIARYDYRKSGSGIWVDYISDLGDGFEATYAMAYLVAQDSLSLAAPRGVDALPTLQAGEILVMGGDQAYPQSSAQEYKERLQNPYDWAFTTKEPKRKLFAIPGNHDWYDGLGAFDTLFCAMRNRVAKGKGNQIGGWRCEQHRSYFAIRLPGDWWIWGADIQLGGTFDKPQRDYFDIMSEQTGDGHKIIICLAEPSWLHEQYDNLHDIAWLAQKKRAKVVAVLAGDWHHYSRYKAENLDVEFITCGGGGAFAHATHGLPDKLPLNWPKVEEQPDVCEYVAPNQSEKHPAANMLPDLTRMGQQAMAPFFMAQKLTEDAVSDPAIAIAPANPEPYDCEVKAIYPSKALSRFLCLKNLWLPFHNPSFALFLGLIYFLYAWVFNVTINAYDTNIRLGEKTEAEYAATKDVVTNLRNQAQEIGNRDDLADQREKSAAFLAYQSVAQLAQAMKARSKILSGKTTVARDTEDSEVGKQIVASETFIRDWKITILQNRISMLREEFPHAFEGLETVQQAFSVDPLHYLAQEYITKLNKHDVAASQSLEKGIEEAIKKATAATASLQARVTALLGDKSLSPAAAFAADRLSDAAREYEQSALDLAKNVHPIGHWDVAQTIWKRITDPQRVLLAGKLNPAFFMMLLGLWLGLIYYAEAGDKWRMGLARRVVVGTLHFFAHVAALLFVYSVIGPGGELSTLAPAIALASVLGIVSLLTWGPGVAVIVGPCALIAGVLVTQTPAGFWTTLSLLEIVGGVLESAWTAVKPVASQLQPIAAFLMPPISLLWSYIAAFFASGIVQDILNVATFSFATILLGGLVGAIIFGLYWTLMSALFAKHNGDAFGALGIANYKHFLRMHFEGDRLTIYPIAIDHVPGRRGWRPLHPEEMCPSHNPQIVPKVPLQPRLIDGPIVINAGAIKA